MFSIYLLNKSWYHLYKRKYTWIDPPSRSVKISAVITYALVSVASLSGIIFPTLQGIGYLEYGYLIGENYPLEPEYPSIYHWSNLFMVIALFAAGFTHLCAYFHVFFRLKQFMNKDQIKDVIPCKYCFCIISFMIFLIPVSLGLLIMINSVHSLFVVAVLLPILIGVDLVSINFVLLYFYARGLYVYAFRRYNTEYSAKKLINTEIVDDRIHELMLESVRYVVLFGSVIIYDTIAAIIACFVLKYFSETDSQCNGVGMIIASIAVFGEMITFLSSIYLSFKFNHDKYLKVCERCHNRILHICYGCVKRKQRKMIGNIQNDYLQL